MQTLYRKAIIAAVEAGKHVLEVYAGDFSVETKSDNSPLTLADKKSNEVVKDALADTGLPFLSEEGKLFSYSERRDWASFWLVDPLDGTKEFVKKSGEFTVNIALIKHGQPVFGVVYVPVTGALYYGAKGEGSFVFHADEFLTSETLEQYISDATSLPVPGNASAYTIVASKNHSSPETEAFIEEKRKAHDNVHLVNAGSSLKLCLVAEGKAQVYPRLAPTMEWDTAAGHAVAIFAGCRVYDFETKQELVYNKENLLNPWFVVER
ncbi:3'(2'),5'-bisphosphate nucleotidase CysQ [Pontibacter silvestris]|uniref:3'(2'),5'-bisphosphate nucleotidase CysQ n=1 Tax=Pontibacter silvestris TaxID=2305183 RepID=A0ABW4WXU4_9BACT|nr:3'(2'),5'-bisphosphate nucleotidase CysQ [Pontibacter silvestris]MCC9137326.1 3'(2'),5'-bisphosphate nucleotidase CysQ [Pontibacter silvestris]